MNSFPQLEGLGDITLSPENLNISLIDSMFALFYCVNYMSPYSTDYIFTSYSITKYKVLPTLELLPTLLGYSHKSFSYDTLSIVVEPYSYLTYHLISNL